MLNVGTVVAVNGECFELKADVDAVRVPKPGAPVHTIGDVVSPGGEVITLTVCDGIVFGNPSSTPDGPKAVIRDQLPKNAKVIDIGEDAPFLVYEQPFADGPKYGLVKAPEIEAEKEDAPQPEITKVPE